MLTYKIGGQSGKSIKLRAAKDLVVVRFANNWTIKDAPLADSAKTLTKSMKLVHSFPDSNVHIFKCKSKGKISATKIRNQIRKQFKEEEAVKFAGRVLVDKDGAFSLYTENLYVQFHEAVKSKDCKKILKSHKLTIKKEVKYAHNGYFVKAPEGYGYEVFAIADKLLKSKEVLYCHPELIKKRKRKSIYTQQWHLKKTIFNGQTIDAHIDIKGAWKHTKGKGIVIAVMDDGVDIDHPEFKKRGKIVSPKDMRSDSANPRPRDAQDEHGTACAGVACAIGKDSSSGVAPEAKLMPIRLRVGLGSMLEAEAFVWAADSGADVISCSWGPEDGNWKKPNDPLHTTQVHLPDSTRQAINYACREGRKGKGCIITWAAGNGREEVKYDGYANNEKVLAISACNDSNSRSVYSDYGQSIVCAFPSSDIGYRRFRHPEPKTPGIWTTDNMGSSGYNSGLPGNETDPLHGDAAGNYTADFGGTSSACPGVAGVIALMLAVNSNLDFGGIKSIIQDSCDIIDTNNGEYDDFGHSHYYGYGRINARKAVENTLKTVAETPEISELGFVQFRKQGAKKISSGKKVASPIAKDRVQNISMRPIPEIEGLHILYSLSFNNLGPSAYAKDGALVNVLDKRRKPIGIEVKLKGIKAKKYKLKYSGLFKDNTKWTRAITRGVCGKKNGTGDALTGVQVDLRPK